jgi:hypothetical protein
MDDIAIFILVIYIDALFGLKNIPSPLKYFLSLLKVEIITIFSFGVSLAINC